MDAKPSPDEPLRATDPARERAIPSRDGYECEALRIAGIVALDFVDVHRLGATCKAWRAVIIRELPCLFLTARHRRGVGRYEKLLCERWMGIRRSRAIESADERHGRDETDAARCLSLLAGPRLVDPRVAACVLVLGWDALAEPPERRIALARRLGMDAVYDVDVLMAAASVSRPLLRYLLDDGWFAKHAGNVRDPTSSVRSGGASSSPSHYMAEHVRRLAALHPDAASDLTAAVPRHDRSPQRASRDRCLRRAVGRLSWSSDVAARLTARAIADRDPSARASAGDDDVGPGFQRGAGLRRSHQTEEGESSASIAVAASRAPHRDASL